MIGAILAVPPGTAIPEPAPARLDVNASIPDELPVFETDTPLMLEVSVNGKSTGLVAEFLVHASNRRLSITRTEMKEIGLRPPASLGSQIYLDDIEGLSFDYFATRQSININALHGLMQPVVSSASYRPGFEEPIKSFGAVLNYSLSAQLGNNSGRGFGLEAASAALDGWIFSPIGTLSSTGFVQHSTGATGQTRFVRQETRFESHNAKHALTFAAGDVMSSSLQWGRPIRMGGVQLRRDFSLRSDLVTEQSLSFSGAAAVPSTVDVFIENNRAYSGTLESGPYELQDLPVYTGAGDAEIVVRDQNGNVTRRKVRFFAAQNLLKKGLADYSLEVGHARQSYGSKSNDYANDMIASGSLRYGLSRKVTLELHAEAKNDLSMYSLGFYTVPFSLAETGLTVGQSHYNGTRAGFVHASLRTTVWGIDVNASSMRSEPGFADLAYATGIDFLGAGEIATSGSLLETPRALDVLSLAIPVGGDNRKLGLSMVNSKRANSEDLIYSASFGRPFANGRGSLSLNGSYNSKNRESRVSLSMSMSLGKRTYVRSNVAHDYTGELTASTSLARSLGQDIGDYGYNFEIEGSKNNAIASARGDYRSRYARFGLEARQGKNGGFLRAEMDGALVGTGGAIVAGNTVRDSFAVVDVGAADVPIYLQNRRAARTNKSGKALVPGLASHRKNRVSLNLRDIPADTTIGVTAMEVVPARRAGTLVDFQGSTAPSVVVVLRDAAGNHLPPGAVIYANGSKSETYVGYDGIAYIEDVQKTNTLKIQTVNGPCTARFTHAKSVSMQDMIDPVVCK
ncbi:fimbria/pilus outer membrane usher protein [Rhodobacteraceae bacterium D3-12]|nr:fimbria/pilus outer membrane usher protein [Rhodobacteraceae bacterium D3-12]